FFWLISRYSPPLSLLLPFPSLAFSGKLLSQLPDLDTQHSALREPLKRKNERQRDRSATPYDASLSNDKGSPTGAGAKARAGGRGKKPPHELLTEEQKKANHIASEQKRRANIRIGFDQLVDIVPTLSHCHRSESLILQKSYDYIHQLIDTKSQLKDRVRELQVLLGDLPDNDSSEDDEIYKAG
ncbi:hypothetical protein BC940DRAFT_349576, partial [Gongronella butleri]